MSALQGDGGAEQYSEVSGACHVAGWPVSGLRGVSSREPDNLFGGHSGKGNGGTRYICRGRIAGNCMGNPSVFAGMLEAFERVTGDH